MRGDLASTDEKLTRLRDPLFVIGLSLEIIKQRSSDTEVQSELKRIGDAMTKIEQIIQVS
jgi:hypothetical protein